MPEKIHRPTWVEVDLGAIEFNLQQIKRKIPEHCEIMAVVKADAYGHGSIEVAKKALQSGATMLAVALLEEALKLREANIDAPILVLGWVDPNYAPIAAEKDITLTFFQVEWLRQVDSLNLDKELKLHMKWDTGMGRIGVCTPEELKTILEELNKNNHIYLTGVYTHFATADEVSVEYYREQTNKFEQLLVNFKKYWNAPVTIHTGNSAAAIRFSEEMHNFIRFGISMYGLYPSSIVKEEKTIHLKQAFSLHSRLVHVKKVPSGTSISYGRSYIAKQDEWIGTIPLGYGDGWNRKLQDTHVLVCGKRLPIVGRICMDQLMIQLDQEYEIGTKVTLIGEQENENISIDEIAQHLNTINYEIPCMINQRVPRVYLENQ